MSRREQLEKDRLKAKHIIGELRVPAPRDFVGTLADADQNAMPEMFNDRGEVNRLATRIQTIRLELETLLVDLLNQLARAGHTSRSKLIEELLNDALHHHAAVLERWVEPMLMKAIRKDRSRSGALREICSRLPSLGATEGLASFRQHLERIHPQVRHARSHARVKEHERDRG